MTTISKYDDVIDSRHVIDRIDELESEIADADEDTDLTDEKEELAELKALAEEASQYASDWSHGETLIHSTYFEKYAEQLAEDIGAVNSDATWPNNHIDWEAAAEELKQDYTEVEFGDQTFYIRAS